jgi:hypothetical protein
MAALCWNGALRSGCCGADLVEVHWRANRRNHRYTAGLEDISSSGVCLQPERPIPLLTAVRIHHPEDDLIGTVKYCVLREGSYFVGVEFEKGCRWSSRTFRPHTSIRSTQATEEQT